MKNKRGQLGGGGGRGGAASRVREAGVNVTNKIKAFLQPAGFNWETVFTAAIAGAIIGAIVGVLLSIFSIVNLGLTGLLSTLLLGVGGLAIFGVAFFILAIIWEGLGAVPEIRMMIVVIVGIGMVLALAIPTYIAWKSGVLPESLKFAQPLFDAADNAYKEIAKFRYCLYADPKCPFFVNWDDPNVQSAKEELQVDVTFSETRIDKNNNINVLVSMSVKNPDLIQLTLRPTCWFGRGKTREFRVEKMGVYSKGDEFVFPPSSQELHTTFRCTGDVPEASSRNIYSENLEVSFERPVNVKTTWPVWLGEEPHVGLVKSEMKYNAPYSIALVSNNDMPFKEGSEYDFQIVLKKQTDNVDFKGIESLELFFPEDVVAECNNFEATDHTLELNSIDKAKLKEIVDYNAEDDKYTFPCNLYITSAPFKAVLAPFDLEAQYIVVSDYETRIIKSPAT